MQLTPLEFDDLDHRVQRVHLKFGDLFEYLQRLYGDENTVEMYCPFGGSPLPHIELIRPEFKAKIELSIPLCAQIVVYIMSKNDDEISISNQGGLLGPSDIILDPSLRI